MKQSTPLRSHSIRTLCECAILLALSIVLSFFQFSRLPYGGSITLASMLPICLVSIKHGLGWGLGTGFCYAWFQILQGNPFAWGLTPSMLLGSLFLDYILAFTILGVAGLFRNKGLAGRLGGITLACGLRFLVHFLAGIILWANYEEFIAFGAEWVNQPVLYSICYNGAYMLPDTLITLAVAVFLFKTKDFNRVLKIEN